MGPARLSFESVRPGGFDRQKLLRHVGDIMSALGVGAYHVGVVFTSDARMQRLNSEYLGVDAPTDILSFPVEERAPGTLPTLDASAPGARMASELGDMYIGLRYVKRHCCEDGVLLQDRLAVLAAHGVCHLLGHDHGARDEWKKMNAEEWKALNVINRKFGRSLAPLTLPPDDG